MATIPTPDEGADLVIAKFGNNLNEAERIELHELVCQLMQDWGDLIASVEAESHRF